MLRSLFEDKNIVLKAEMMRMSFDLYKRTNIGVRAKTDDYSGSNRIWSQSKHQRTCQKIKLLESIP